MKNESRRKTTTADAACNTCAERVNETARRAGHLAREQRREGLNVPFAAFASLAGVAGLPFVTF